jgi:hypothetical protein
LSAPEYAPGNGSVVVHDIVKNWDAVYAGGVKTP